MRGIAQPIGVAEAADHLGISVRRVQQMLKDGRLHGTKLGSQWVLDRLLLDDIVQRGRITGRPLLPQNVWILLLQASGEPVPRSASQGAASRMAALLRSRGLAGLRPALAGRGKPMMLNGHAGVLAPLREAPEVVLSGISAANRYGFGVASSGEMEGYVRADNLDQIQHQFALNERADGNVLLRVVDDEGWMLRARFAPLAAVALDLADARDPRSRQVGLRAVREIDRTMGRTGAPQLDQVQ